MTRSRGLPGLLAVAVISWAQTALGNGRFPLANQLVVDASDEQHIVARTTFGLVQSLDGGAHWSWICESAIQADGFLDPPLTIGSQGAILVGLDDGVHLGEDSGCQWTRAQADYSGEEVIDLAGNSTDIFATSLAQMKGALQARVAASTDGGQHFATLGSVLDDASPVTIEVAPSLSSRLYLGMLDGNLENGLIARSDDGGLSWVRSPAPSGPDSVYLSAVDPNDPDRVYLRSMFPSSVLFVSTDGGTAWSAAYTSVSELTGFALSPDGQRVAVGSADGVAILDAAGSAGTPYEVIATYSTPVNCLTWHETALYACSTDASGGFSIGVSADGRGDFSPLLRFADLEPITCPSNPVLVQCANAPCAIGDLFDAGCAAPAALLQEDAGSRAPVSTPILHAGGGSCTLGHAPGSGRSGARVFGLLLSALAFRRRRDRRQSAPGTRGEDRTRAARPRTWRGRRVRLRLLGY
jgi:photosystem II stability/assembly factor-like uncharacterized protein